MNSISLIRSMPGHIGDIYEVNNFRICSSSFTILFNSAAFLKLHLVQLAGRCDRCGFSANMSWLKSSLASAAVPTIHAQYNNYVFIH